MPHSLASYIDRLLSEGEIVEIATEVSPEYEIAELTDRESKLPGGGKALLFSSTGTQFMVATNLMGSERRMSMALGVENLDALTERLDSVFRGISSPKDSLWDKLRMLPLMKEASRWFPRVSSSRGECQHTVHTGRDARLSMLPILRCWEHDGGRFITLPMVNTVDPETGIRNVGMYRMQVFDDYSTGMHWHMHKTGARHYESYRRLKRRMPVSVAIGGDPIYAYSATAPLPDNVDEYLLAGFLRSEPVRLVKCITNDLMVPSDCDFVIEGYVDPEEEKHVEGAFGDHTGFYSLTDMYPVFHVTAITHRRDAIYPATVVGIPPEEDAWISKATEKIFLSPIRFALFPEVRDMHMPVEGVSHNLVICSIATRYPGNAVKVAQGMWGAGQMMFNKYMMLIPEKMPASDYEGICALIRKCRPERCTTFSEGVYDVLDHATSTTGYGGKMAIDLTEVGPDVTTASVVDYKSDTYEVSSRYAARLNLAVIYTASQEVDVSGIITRHGIEAPAVAVFDFETRDLDGRELLWIGCANTDPGRDCFFLGSTLVIDCRWKCGTKQGFPERFPNVATSSPDTIEKVDRRWAEYGLGERIESPSGKYRHLLRSGSAECK